MQEIIKNDKAPSRLYIAYHMFREVFVQGSLWGLILTIATYNFYLSMCYYLKSILGEYGTERIIFTCLVSTSHIVVFYTLSTIFTLFDKFSILQQYKMPRTNVHKNESKQLFWKTFMEVSVYMLILNPILAYILYPVFVYFGSSSIYSPLPSTFIIMRDFAIAHLFNDFFFYWTHRFLHAYLYQYHKQHHVHHGPISICSEYAHPIEALLSNVFPTLGGVIFFPTHCLIGIVWLTLRVRQTLETHSGFCFNHPVTEFLGITHASGAAHHDYHHSVNQPGNFGEGEYMDYLFNTLKKYVNNGHMEGYINKKEKAS